MVYAMRETELAAKLYNLLKKSGVGSLKKVYKGRSVTSKEFKDVVSEWYGERIPWPLIEPDLILVFEDYKKVIDEVMIVAVELKCFQTSSDKRLRRAFREIGQPLRCYVFGFDSAVLWHVFEDVEEDVIKDYTDMVYEVIEKLKLPLAYIATKIIKDQYKIYKPLNLKQQNIQYLVMYLQNLCAHTRNPAMDEKIKKRRSALKVALRIPS